MPEILDVQSLPPAAELRALECAAVLWYTQGDLERARAGLDRALTLGHAGDIDTVVAQDLSARVEHALGNLTAARERFTRAVEGFRSLGILWGTGNALSGMASLALRPATPAKQSACSIRPCRCSGRPVRGS